jgi:hypothetical protein
LSAIYVLIRAKHEIDCAEPANIEGQTPPFSTTHGLLTGRDKCGSRGGGEIKDGSCYRKGESRLLQKPEAAAAAGHLEEQILTKRQVQNQAGKHGV